VETLHGAETFSPRSTFYFRATKSFHANRCPGADSRDGGPEGGFTKGEIVSGPTLIGLPLAGA
jgi:hypothetical protein